jgi:hypothetical protein
MLHVNSKELVIAKHAKEVRKCMCTAGQATCSGYSHFSISCSSAVIDIDTTSSAASTTAMFVWPL